MSASVSSESNDLFFDTLVRDYIEENLTSNAAGATSTVARGDRRIDD